VIDGANQVTLFLRNTKITNNSHIQISCRKLRHLYKSEEMGMEKEIQEHKNKRARYAATRYQIAQIRKISDINKNILIT